MTTPTVLPLVTALQAALEAVPLTVYLGGAPAVAALPKRYAVLYPDSGTASAASLADDRTTLGSLVQITYVATTPDGALGAADQGRAALATLSVSGRQSWRPEELGGPPLQRDDDTTPPLYYLPVQYRLRSTPA